MHQILRAHRVRYLVVASCLFLLHSGYAQTNVLDNGSFELGQQPDCWAQGDFAEDWQSRKYDDQLTGKITHSPEYFDDNVNFYAASQCVPPHGQGVGEPKFVSGAHTGRRYIGMGAYELIQQHITALTPGRYYTAVLYIAPNYDPFNGLWQGGTGKLKIGLARHDVNYKAGNPNVECTEDYVTYEDGLTQEIMEVGTLDLNIADFDSPDSWRRVTFSFVAPNDGIDDFDWFFLDVEVPGFEGVELADDQACIGDYVYIDDVAIYDARLCGAVCSPELGGISYGYYEGNPESELYGDWIPNATPNYLATGTMAFSMYITNAISITLEVITPSNQLLYVQREFDPNGLIDAGYQDYFFGWHGVLPDGTTLPFDTYAYHLKIENCNPGDVVTIAYHALHYQPEWSDPGPYVETRSFDLNDCCLDHKYYQNTVLNGDTRTYVHDFITAGSNVTTGATGPVIVPANSYCYFQAGTAINIEPGFVVEPGGAYLGVIAECDRYGSRQQVDPLPRRLAYPDMPVSQKGSHGLVLSPNPTSGLVSVTWNEEVTGPGWMDIVDAHGIVVKQYPFTSAPNSEIDFSGLSAGQYVLRVYSTSGVVSSRVVKL